MARVPSAALPFTFPQLDPDAFETGKQREAVDRFNSQIKQWHGLLNGRISLGTGLGYSGHIDGEIIELNTTALNADFAWPHNLGRVPAGALQMISDGATDLFRRSSTPPHNDKLLWFRSAESVGTRYLVLVF